MNPLNCTPSGALNLEQLRFADTVALGQSVRFLGAKGVRQDQAAQLIVDHLYNVFRHEDTGERACTLVRCFQTQAYSGLPPEMQRAALRLFHGAGAAPQLRCLSLLATRGDAPGWNRPTDSAEHFAIPLPDIAMIQRAPMIAQLLAQMGVDAADVVAPTSAPSAFVLDAGRRSFNVFHVEDARGSAYIPAQKTFVQPYGIRSVVGMGGLLPSGEFFALILFARVRIPRETVALFRTLALSVKLAFLRFAANEVFSRDPE